MRRMDEQEIDKLYEKIINALENKQLQKNNDNEANEKIDEITKRFNKFLKEPYSFRVLKEIGNALRNKDPFYAKYLRIKAPIYDFDKLVEIASADDELKKHFDTSKDYDVDLNYLATLISPKDERRTVVVTPVAIFGINAKFETVSRVVSGEHWPIVSSLFPPLHSFAVSSLNAFHSFGLGALEILGGSWDTIESVISSIAKKDYPWKKKKIEVRSTTWNNLVSKKFKDKDYLINHTSMLYKGDLNEKYIAIFPPEKVSAHIGKILRFYFDKKRVKNQIKLLNNSIDITDIQLPGLKKRKIKVKDKVEKMMKPYYDIVEADKTDDKPFEIVPHKNNDDLIDTRILLMLAYKEKNEDVALNELSIYPDFVIAKRNIIYAFSDSIIKISKKQFQSTNPRYIINEVIDIDSSIDKEINETVRKAVHRKFNFKPEDIRTEFSSLYDGMIFAVNKPVGSNKLSWTSHNLVINMSNKKQVKSFVDKRDRIIWVKRREIEKLKKEKLKEKYLASSSH